MRAVVLGGGGFIGTNVCRKLVSQGYEVRAFGRHFVDPQALVGAEIVQGDFNDETVVATALQGADVIIHSIHATFPPAANVEMAADVNRSVVGTIRLLEAARASGVRKIVFFSSGGTVYGTPLSIPIDESHPTNPIGAYGVNKLMIEKYVSIFENLYGITGYILRISNPYGPYQLGIKQQGLIPNVYNKIRSKRTVQVFGDGKNTRDYIFIDDVCDAVSCILEYQGLERCFNVGVGGRGHTILDIVGAVAMECKIEAEIEFVPARAFDVRSNILDTSKLQRETMWKPRVSLYDGIVQTVDWLDRHNATGVK